MTRLLMVEQSEAIILGNTGGIQNKTMLCSLLRYRLTKMSTRLDLDGITYTTSDALKRIPSFGLAIKGI